MKALILPTIALALLSTVANARDNDGRATWKWLQSITHDQAAQGKQASNDSGGGSSSTGAPLQQQKEDKDRGGRHR